MPSVSRSWRQRMADRQEQPTEAVPAPPSGDATKAVLQEWLDTVGVSYPSSATKADLIALIEETPF